MNRGIGRYAPWIIALVIVFLDQLTKRFVIAKMALGDSLSFIGELVRWTYIRNDGLAFGVDMPGGRLLGILSLVATVVFVFILIKMNNETQFTKIILGLIIGGAIGNTIDRLAYGYVIDFIDVDMPNWIMDRWHVFNVADSAVSVGVVLLMISILFFKENVAILEEKNESDISERSASSPETVGVNTPIRQSSYDSGNEDSDLPEEDIS